ncbi:LysE family translocator [uncultured Lentibacter sp.]|uniref:LysE family translocator n=1 Tax=uncultured Lentibacter sp. TaxID=1659309 RepID=UPI002609266E|nr:LysE family translocator [uncultured Lentibacter sp.]
MTVETWIAFILASSVLLMIPGPTILLVMSYAISKGRSVALASAAGVALGDLAAMSASLAGLGALVLASATAFSVLKWVGAAYLVYLGVTLLRSARNGQDDSLALPKADQSVTPRGVFAHAAAVTALNPKSIAFFIAFVPQFIRPEAAVLPQIGVLVATFVSLATLNALAYALLADHLRSFFSQPRALVWMTRTGGATLIAMGLFTATLKRATS